jgi:HAE1 family hydrophobic/amphiphilic exporter-1
MGSTVASPLERQFTTIAGVDEMTSSSSAGSTNITLSFDLDRNVDSAVVDVQTAIAAAMPLLPSTLTFAAIVPQAESCRPADLMLNLTSSTLSMAAVDEFAENVLAPRISTVEGVSQVQVQGAQKYAVRVQLDPDRMRSQKVGMNEVDQALVNWNANEPTGQLFGHDSSYTITANGLLQRPDGNILKTAEKFKSLVITYVNGRPYGLDEVANVADSVETVTQAAWLYTKQGRQRAITLQVQKQPGTNVIQVTDAVRKVLPSLQAQLPPSVHLSIRQDRSRTIRRAFSDIQITMLITLALVVGVIYLFLHNWSATLIPALALPFSILGTFAVMKMLGYSLDNLSMMALILSIGFVVDDAIVMLENIVRIWRRANSRSRPRSRLARDRLHHPDDDDVACRRLHSDPVHGRHPRRLFREFAVTITTAVLISGIVSVTLTPMLCSRFLKVVHKKVGLAGRMDRGFDALQRGYGWSLALILRHRLAMLVVFGVVLMTTLHMFGVVPKGSSLIRTTISCSSTCGRRRGRRSMRWLGSRRRSRIC